MSVGVVSRVEPQQYVHGATSLLAIQVCVCTAWLIACDAGMCVRGPAIQVFRCLYECGPQVYVCVWFSDVCALERAVSDPRP